jgi:hypothetical protein
MEVPRLGQLSPEGTRPEEGLMYRWFAGLVATAALAVAIPTLAHGAPDHHCNVNLTMLAHRVKTFSGKPPSSGHDLHAGVVDGKICGKRFRGAAREENRYPEPPGFTIKLATFGPIGSFRSKGDGTAVVNPDGKSLTLTGQMDVTGGTGVYKGSSGSLEFTARVPFETGVAKFHLTGELDY